MLLFVLFSLTLTQENSVKSNNQTLWPSRECYCPIENINIRLKDGLKCLTYEEYNNLDLDIFVIWYIFDAYIRLLFGFYIVLRILLL